MSVGGCVEVGQSLAPECKCIGQASGECAGCYRDLAEVEVHYDDGDDLWCDACVPRGGSSS